MSQIDPAAADEARRYYAEELRFVGGLKREEVVAAFAKVPRERFLGPPPWKLVTARDGYRDVAGGDPRDTYHNVLYGLDTSRGLNNGQPAFLAYLIDESGAGEGGHAVHIGCGTGYYTAILAELVGEGGHVTAIEIDEVLAERARENLEPWSQVDVKQADGTRFDPGAADAILVNAGATHPAPLWLERLLPGGKLIVPLTVNLPKHGMGWILKLHHTPKGFAAHFISTVGIFHCAGARDDDFNRLLSQAFQRGNEELQKVRSLRRDEHVAGEECWLHTGDFCLSNEELG
jgi:protein-L-isoaspartate(D-aspartate) O-methyltransferase